MNRYDNFVFEFGIILIIRCNGLDNTCVNESIFHSLKELDKLGCIGSQNVMYEGNDESAGMHEIIVFHKKIYSISIAN